MIRGVQGLIGRYTPSLLLDFSKGVMPASLTFGRASVATRMNPNGLIETVAADVPRFDYQITSQRTNKLRYSNTLSNASWTKRGTATLTQDGTTDPEGGTAAWLASGISFPGNGDFFAYTNCGEIATSRYALSFWIKRVTATGTISVQNPVDGNLRGNWSVNLSLLSSGWERITRTHPAVTINSEFVPHSFGTGNNGGILLSSPISTPISFYFYGAQIEPDTIITTAYIPTTTAPATLTTTNYRGMLIESSRTNRIIQSENFASGWAAAVTGTSNRTNISLPFCTNAGLVEVTSADGGCRQSISGLSGVNHAFSCYIESANSGTLGISLENGAATYGTACSLTFNAVTGAISINTGFSSATATQFLGGWMVSIILPVAAGGLSANVEFRAPMGYAFKLAMPQFEAGTFSTSYIPTTTAAVTRAGDATSLATGSWYNPVQGSTYSEFTPAVNGNNNGVYSFNAGNSQNRMDLRAGPGGGGNAVISVSNVNQSTPAGQGTTALVNHRFGFSYIAGGTSLVKDGGTVATAATASIPTVTQLQIGNLDGGFGSNNLDGWIKKFVYYPRRLADNYLKSLTI